MMRWKWKYLWWMKRKSAQLNGWLKRYCVELGAGIMIFVLVFMIGSVTVIGTCTARSYVMLGITVQLQQDQISRQNVNIKLLTDRVNELTAAQGGTVKRQKIEARQGAGPVGKAL